MSQMTRGYSPTRVIVEHTSANPLALPHYGNLRNSIIGDWTARALEFLGDMSVDTQYYVNDLGTNCAAAVEFIMQHGMPNYKYSQAKTRFKAQGLQSGSLKKLEDSNPHGNDFKELKDQLILMELAKIKLALSKLHVWHDRFTFESSLLKRSRALLKWGLNVPYGQTTLFRQQGGRVIESVTGSPLTRSDGTSLYMLNDITYNCLKNTHYDRVYCVLCEDHKAHSQRIQRITRVIAGLHPSYKLAKISRVITYRYVIMDGQKLSKTAGHVLGLDDMYRRIITLGIPKAFALRYVTLSINGRRLVQVDKISQVTLDRAHELYAHLKTNYCILHSRTQKMIAIERDIFDFEWYLSKYFIENTNECLLRICQVFRQINAICNNSVNASIYDFICRVKKLFGIQ